MFKQNNFIFEEGETIGNPIKLKEIYYNCSKCSSPIEILSINEKTNIIKFRCITNNHRETLTIKEYITKKKIPIQNLYNEDDEFDLDNKIIGESIKSLIPKWNFAFDELNIDDAFTFADSDFYSPSIKDKINEEEKKKQQSEKLSNDMAIILKYEFFK